MKTTKLNKIEVTPLGLDRDAINRELVSEKLPNLSELEIAFLNFVIAFTCQKHKIQIKELQNRNNRRGSPACQYTYHAVMNIRCLILKLLLEYSVITPKIIGALFNQSPCSISIYKNIEIRKREKNRLFNRDFESLLIAVKKQPMFTERPKHEMKYGELCLFNKITKALPKEVVG